MPSQSKKRACRYQDAPRFFIRSPFGLRARHRVVPQSLSGRWSEVVPQDYKDFDPQGWGNFSHRVLWRSRCFSGAAKESPARGFTPSTQIPSPFRTRLGSSTCSMPSIRLLWSSIC